MICIGIKIKILLQKNRETGKEKSGKERFLRRGETASVDWKRSVALSYGNVAGKMYNDAYHSASIASSRHRFSLSKRRRRSAGNAE